MAYFLLKTLVSALIIAGISELGRRVPLLAAVLASLPLVSVLGMIWLYRDTGDLQQVSRLAGGIFWLVIPSLILFALFPVLASRGLGFGPALSLAVVATIAGYFLMLRLLGLAGISI